MSSAFSDRVVVVTPRWPALTSVAAAVIALVVAVLEAMQGTRSLAVLVLGYGLGAVATTALCAVHRALRDGRRRDPRFRVERGFDALARASMGLGLLAGLADAFLLATELAK